MTRVLLHLRLFLVLFLAVAGSGQAQLLMAGWLAGWWRAGWWWLVAGWLAGSGAQRAGWLAGWLATGSQGG